MIYREFEQLDLPGLAKEILDFWEKEKIFEKSISVREGSPAFTFYEGPPSANGLPGIHHVMSRTIKDLFCRYKTLKGFQVKRKAGWDTHGLPIELAVEKTLGITKEDIGKTISIEDYNKACRKEVMKYTDKWEELTHAMGYWVDMKNPYITYENYYIESVWFLLKELYKKELLYKGFSIQPYSPAAGTGLSSHELNLPGCYRPVKDTTVVAMFKISQESLINGHVKNLPNDLMTHDIFLLAWTTTPWTLPSNTALAVGEKMDYVFVKTYNPYSHHPVVVVLAKELASKYFPEENASLKFDEYKKGDKKVPFQIIHTCKGKYLKDIRYEQLLPYAQPTDGDAFKVVLGDFVSTEEGTGVVHIAPSFGADDFRTAKQNGLSSLTLVDKRGRFTEEMDDPLFGFAGEFVKEEFLNDEGKKAELEKQQQRLKTIIPKLDKYLSVDERLALKLKLENKAFRIEKYEHNYPHCWRTDKPVLYYPLDSWFIKTTAKKDRMVELNKTINWKPESTGTGRFGVWLENLVDWNLSRSRYWGIPLPVWRTEDGSEELCIGSVEELKKEIEKAITAGFMDPAHLEHIDVSKPDFDMHRPYVDNIILASPSGKKMFREADLIDVWFDSGAMPFAQWGATSTNDPKFRAAFPADFIAEGVDQTRGWFYTLHAISVMLFDSVAYKNVVSNGLVLDKSGNKMSKRLGNVVNPFETINKYGPDTTRWYLISNSQPWDNLKFDMSGIEESRRKFFGTLYNTYAFFALYANIDKFKIDEQNIIPVKDRIELDRWIISRLHSLVKEVESCYDDYEPTKATRAIELFVDEHFSNWYVRLSRRRFWKGEMSGDKKAAYETLFECLMITAQLISPVAPFFAEWLYKNLSDPVRDAAIKNKTPLAPGSVHLTLFTKAEENAIDNDLEEKMQLAQDLSSMVLSLRKKAGIKVRQPLNRIMVPILDEKFRNKLKHVEPIILSEVNVKKIEYVDDASGIIVKKVKPNFKVLGTKLGRNMKGAADKISGFNPDDIARLEEDGKYPLFLNGIEIEISIDEVEIVTEDIPGWLVAVNGKLTVALDTTITEQLRDEGKARELVNRIQNLRKARGFEVTDRISVRIQNHDGLNNSINNNLDYIRTEILATSLEIVEKIDASEGVLIEVDDDIQTLTLIKKE